MRYRSRRRRGRGRGRAVRVRRTGLKVFRRRGGIRM